MISPYLSSPANVIALLIWHIKHQQLKDAKVVLKINSSFCLICVYLICMYKFNDAFNIWTPFVMVTFHMKCKTDIPF